MTTTIRNLLRTLSVAALLAAAAMSMPAGDVQAAVKCPNDPQGTPARQCCVYKGVAYVPGSHFTVGNKSYDCEENGEWLIITDEKLDPGTQPPQPRFPWVFVAPGSGGVLAQP